MLCDAEYVVLELRAPSALIHKIGVLLLDPFSGRLFLRVRDDVAVLAPSERCVLEPLAEDLASKAVEMGGEKLLAWLEDSLSNVLRITDRVRVAVDSFTRVLDRLFEQHVGNLKVLPFRTHLPLYSLRAAAGRFGEEQVVEPEDWVRVPESLRLTEGMFVAHVAGRSMEPRIPDGSLSIFRTPVVGSRQSKIVLVELLAEREEAARYTIKRYTSCKTQTADGEWAHESITLHPLNPEFQPFGLSNGEFRVIAEWLQVLE
ncbi:MAG: S24 family peptidase [Bryobacteraceae bacterium]